TVAGTAALAVEADGTPASPAEQDAAEDEDGTAEDGTAERPAPVRDDHGIAADLEALATARGATRASRPAGDPERRSQAQIDFASLLFQAPAPAPRTTVGAQDAPVGSAEVAFGAPELPGDEAEDETGTSAEDTAT